MVHSMLCMFSFTAIKKNVRTIDSLYINNLGEMGLDLVGYLSLHPKGTSKRSKVLSFNI